jgi:hypothetical protein
MTEEDRLFISEPVKLETITNTKEINCNIDKIQNPFQNLKKAREDLFRKKLDWIKNLTFKE